MTADEGATPQWFTDAMATPGASAVAEVEGCDIHYLSWGDPAAPGLMIVPPSGGHARWFDHVAPMFADQFHVVVMDPAGCGDSGRRETYTGELITAEIMGVLSACGLLSKPTPPVLVGHSAGAQYAVRAALAHDEALLGVIGVDGLRYAHLEKDPAVKVFAGPRPPPKPSRVYASFEEAVGRWRLSPEPLIPVGHDFVLDHIARNSFRQVEGGWTSKYDPGQGASISLALELLPAMKDLRCRAASLYAEHTHLADETAPTAVAAQTAGRVASFRIPGASHFPMIDSPAAFVAAIKGLALAWLADAARSR